MSRRGADVEKTEGGCGQKPSGVVAKLCVDRAEWHWVESHVGEVRTE